MRGLCQPCSGIQVTNATSEVASASGNSAHLARKGGVIRIAAHRRRLLFGSSERHEPPEHVTSSVGDRRESKNRKPLLEKGLRFKLLPVQVPRRSRNGQKRLCISHDYHTVRVDYAPVLKVGKPPEEQPKTARRLRTRVRKGEVVNAVKVARKYQKFLERPEVLGYRRLIDCLLSVFPHGNGAATALRSMLFARSTEKHSVTVPIAVQGMRASGVAIGFFRFARKPGTPGRTPTRLRRARHP